MSEEAKYRVFVDYTGEVTNKKAKSIGVEMSKEDACVLILENLPNEISKDDRIEVFRAISEKEPPRVESYLK